MNWRQLAGDRRVQIAGVAAAGGAGLFVWYRHRAAAGTGTGGGTDTSSSDTAATPGTYVPGSFPDTSGTDVASWLGQQVPGIESDIEDYLASHPATPGSPPPPTTPNPTTPLPKTPMPSPKPQPTPRPGTNQSVTVTKYQSTNPAWSSTLSGIAGHYHTSVAALLKLNPQVKNPNVIRTGQKIRVS